MRIIYLPIAFLTIILLFACGSGNKTADKDTDTFTNSSDSVKQGSLELLEDRSQKDPNNTELLNQLAREYIKNNRLQEAYEQISRALQLDSTKAAFHLTMADIYYASSRVYNAKESLEKALRVEPGHPEASMRLAELHFILREYDASVALLNMVLQKDKKNATALFMRGMVFKENTDTARAIRDFQSAIEADPDYYNAYMQLGMMFQLRNDPASEGYFTQAIRIKPESEEALYGRALWYQDHGKLDKAIQDYTAILQSNPRNKDAHFGLGYIHHIHLQVYAEAIRHYSGAIQADPRYAEAYYNRGLCYEAVGNLDPAESDFKMALTIRPDYPPAKEGLKRVGK